LEKSALSKWLQNLFVIPNLAFLSLGVIDLEYYKFIGRRTNFEINSIMGDVGNQAQNLLGKYWYLALIMLFLSWIFIKFLPKTQKNFHSVVPFRGIPSMFLWHFYGCAICFRL
jgi:uncharacterized sulfatase